MVRKTFNIILAIAVALVLWVMLYHPDWMVLGMPKAGAQGITVNNGDKSYDACPTPPAFATVGHCADKCAIPTDTLTGFDPRTGAAICVSPPTNSIIDDPVYNATQSATPDFQGK